MLQVLKNWPNTTTAAICTVVLAVVFILSIATSPAHYRAAATVGSAQTAAMPDDPFYKEGKPGGPDEPIVDFRTVFPQTW
jgi:hypothetical protein